MRPSASSVETTGVKGSCRPVFTLKQSLCTQTPPWSLYKHFHKGITRIIPPKRAFRPVFTANAPTWSELNWFRVGIDRPRRLQAIVLNSPRMWRHHQSRGHLSPCLWCYVPRGPLVWGRHTRVNEPPLWAAVDGGHHCMCHSGSVLGMAIAAAQPLLVPGWRNIIRCYMKCSFTCVCGHRHIHQILLMSELCHVFVMPCVVTVTNAMTIPILTNLYRGFRWKSIKW